MSDQDEQEQTAADGRRASGGPKNQATADISKDKGKRRRAGLTGKALTHTRKKNYECGECGKYFDRMGTLTRHILTHTGVRDYKCGECGKTFALKSNLTTHKIIHTGVRNYTCEECGKTFLLKSHLIAHTLTHTGERNYQCAECGKSFPRKTTLTKHNLTHTGVRNYACEECGKTFMLKSHLATHALTHSGEKNYECVECGKKFSRKDTLTRHTVTHSGEGNISARSVAKLPPEEHPPSIHPYPDAGSHMRAPHATGQTSRQPPSSYEGNQRQVQLPLDSGKKNYECEECGKKFSRKGSLTRHTTTHSGEGNINVRNVANPPEEHPPSIHPYPDACSHMRAPHAMAQTSRQQPLSYGGNQHHMGLPLHPGAASHFGPVSTNMRVHEHNVNLNLHTPYPGGRAPYGAGPWC